MIFQRGLKFFTSLGSGAILLAMAVSCSSNKIKSSENPEAIFAEGQRLLEDGSFIESKEMFDEIRHRFPQSRFAALAELRSADLDFKQDNFTEAAASYGVFLDLYPNHPEAAYALYQKALSYYNDSPEKVARDQSTALNAASAATALLKRYPSSEYRAKAEDLFQKSRLKLAEKEAYVARFYERRKSKLAAYRRWEGLRKSFADLQEFKSQPDALKLYAEANEKADKLGKEVAEMETAESSKP